MNGQLDIENVGNSTMCGQIDKVWATRHKSVGNSAKIVGNSTRNPNPNPNPNPSYIYIPKTLRHMRMPRFQPD